MSDRHYELELGDDVPSREREVLELLKLVLREVRHISTIGENVMSALTDLQAADQLEASALVTIGQAITDVGNRVTAAIASLGNSDDPAVAAVATDLQTHAATLQTLATALAAIAPATTVTTPVDNPIAAPPAGEAPAVS